MQLLTARIKESNLLCHVVDPILTPDWLQYLTDHQKSFDKDAKRLTGKAQSYRGKSRARCTCFRINQTTQLNCEFLQYPALRNHTCPIHDQKKRTFFLFKRWILFNWMVSISIRVSLNTKKGAGGFSISPHLSFRATVTASSPIFYLLLEVQKSLRHKEAGAAIENAQKELHRLLRERKGSYSDTLPNGDTILHVSQFQSLPKVYL